MKHYDVPPQDYCWTQGLYTVFEGYDQPAYNIPYPGLLPDEAPPCTPVKLKGKPLVPITDLFNVSQNYCWYTGIYTLEIAYRFAESFAPYPGIAPLEFCIPGMSLNIGNSSSGGMVKKQYLNAVTER